MRCPPLAQYDADTLIRAANEMDALGDQSAVYGMIGDYGVLREQCRKMQGPDV